MDHNTGYQPRVNEPCRVREMVIIPFYVRLSEAPTRDGGCVTGPLVANPAGWYVEYRMAGDETMDHRDFFAFGEVQPLLTVSPPADD